MVNTLKFLEADLRTLGFPHTWKLAKHRDIPDVVQLPQENAEGNLYLQTLLHNTKRPLHQSLDIIVPTIERTPSQAIQYQKFQSIVGSVCSSEPNDQEERDSSPVINPETHLHTDDANMRQNLIKEFIDSEVHYVKMLRYIVGTLKKKCSPPVLRQFTFNKIFINIDKILEKNEAFLRDLQSNSETFGDVCAKHISEFRCYRKYMLEYSESERLQSKQYQSNQSYRGIVVQARSDPATNYSSIQDMMILPVQRVPRYNLLFKEILKYTPSDHPDFVGLHTAGNHATEIALLNEDDRTKKVTLLHRLMRSMKDTPCTVVREHRDFVTCLDVSEINLENGKAGRPVTLFLFSDKLIAASRPSHSCSGRELAAIDDETSGTSPFLNFTVRKQPLKFKGWVDVEQVEIFQGANDWPGSFMIRVRSQSQVDPAAATAAAADIQDPKTHDYLTKRPRLFSTIPPKENGECADLQGHMDEAASFVKLLLKTKAIAKQTKSEGTMHRLWNNMDVYSNIHDMQKYAAVKHKSNIAVVYVDQGSTVNLASLFDGARQPPWIVAIVQPEGNDFWLRIASKIPLEPELDRSCVVTQPPIDTENDDFERFFFNNIIHCERFLRWSKGFGRAHDSEGERELTKRSRSRPRSLSHSASLQSIGKLLGSYSTSRSRSSSPSRNASANATVAPTSTTSGFTSTFKLSASRSSPIQGSTPSADQKSSTKKDLFTIARKPVKKSRSRRSSFSSSAASVLSATQDWLTRKSSPDSTESITQEPTRLRKTSQVRTSSPPLHVTTSQSSFQDPNRTITASPLQVSPDYRSSSSESFWESADRFTPGAYGSHGSQSSTRKSSNQKPVDESSMLMQQHIQSVYNSLSMDHRAYPDPGVSFTSHPLQDIQSRPSSRGSTGSSNASGGFVSPFRSSPHSAFSNGVSTQATQSSRSSVSLEEIDVNRQTPPPQLNMPSLRKTDDFLKTMEQLFAPYGNGTTDPVTAGRTVTSNATAAAARRASHPPIAVDPVVQHAGDTISTLHSQLDNKYRMFSEHLLRSTERLHARTAQVDAVHGLCETIREDLRSTCDIMKNELETVTAVLASYHRVGSESQAGLDALVARQVEEARMERNHWQRVVRSGQVNPYARHSRA